MWWVPIPDPKDIAQKLGITEEERQEQRQIAKDIMRPYLYYMLKDFDSLVEEDAILEAKDKADYISKVWVSASTMLMHMQNMSWGSAKYFIYNFRPYYRPDLDPFRPKYWEEYWRTRRN